MSIIDRVVPGIAGGNVDLTDFDIAAMIDSDVGRAARASANVALGALRETTYIGVGFAVLGVQRVNARRREPGRTVRP